jgi:hypothetical protein
VSNPLDPPDVWEGKGTPFATVTSSESFPEPLHLTVDSSLTVRRATDWQLLRKFAQFWPRGRTPADFPWLADLVTREKAWRWVSQFPARFASITHHDRVAIREFIRDTLTQVEVKPEVDDPEGKGCCKKKGPDDTFQWPEETEDNCWHVTCNESECGDVMVASEGFNTDGGFEAASLGGRFCAKKCCMADVDGEACGECTWYYTA